MPFRLHRIAATALLAPMAAALAQTEPAQRVEITAASLAKLDQGAASGSRLGLTVRETPATVTMTPSARWTRRTS